MPGCALNEYAIRKLVCCAPMPIASDSGTHRLVPHPLSPRGAVSELVVTVARTKDARLSLRYRLSADLSTLLVPEPRPALRIDGLWRHTCFEAFIGRAGGGEYREYNFSPSGAWAAYQFAAYREGMAPLMSGVPPVLRRHDGDDSLELDVTVDLSGMRHHPSVPGLRLGLAAVVEDKARVLSYWALLHGSEKPDFHHAGGFVIDLE
jgi:hypothetical protein